MLHLVPSVEDIQEIHISISIDAAERFSLKKTNVLLVIISAYIHPTAAKNERPWRVVPT